MNENNNLTNFDDLFVKEEKSFSHTNEPEDNKPFIYSILTYFIVFFLISTLIQLFFIGNKNNLQTLTSTEATIEYLTNELGYSFTTFTDLRLSENRYDVTFVEFDDYAIIYSNELKNDEDFNALLNFENDQDLIDFFKADSPYLKLNNKAHKEFLDKYGLFENDFDLEVKEYTTFKNSISATINFITYVLATIPIFIILFKFVKKDFKNVDKRVKVFLSFVLVGYLYMILGNLISNFATSIIRLITNTKDTTSVNQAAINKILKSNYAILMIIPVVLFAPIVEELVFRKSIFGLIKNEKIALVVSSLLFGLIHVLGDFNNSVNFIVNLISYSVPGAALGLFYLKSEKNIIAPIIAHSVSNIISIIVVLFIL